MAYLFLEYPKCGTCRKAKSWLDASEIAYVDRDIVKENPTEAEIAAWQHKSGLPLKRFFNTSGMLYREMKLKERLPEMTEAQQIALLATEGMLVKRPLLITEDRVLIGFDEAMWETLGCTHK